MDCPHKIPPLSTPAPHHKAHRNCYSSSNSRNNHEDRGRSAEPNPSPDRGGITAQATVHLTEITQGHKDRTETTTTEAVQGDPT